MKDRNLYFHLMMTLLMMGFIFFQSALPADLSSRESNIIVLTLAGVLKVDAERLSFIVRKMAHFTEYMILGVLLLCTVKDIFAQRALELQASALYAAVISWGIGTLYAVSDELHQFFVPGRSCEIRDMIIDSCGTAVGIAVCMIRRRRNL